MNIAFIAVINNQCSKKGTESTVIGKKTAKIKQKTDDLKMIKKWIKADNKANK